MLQQKLYIYLNNFKNVQKVLQAIEILKQKEKKKCVFGPDPLILIKWYPNKICSNVQEEIKILLEEILIGHDAVDLILKLIQKYKNKEHDNGSHFKSELFLPI